MYKQLHPARSAVAYTELAVPRPRQRSLGPAPRTGKRADAFPCPGHHPTHSSYPPRARLRQDEEPKLLTAAPTWAPARPPPGNAQHAGASFRFQVLRREKKPKLTENATRRLRLPPADFRLRVRMCPSLGIAVCALSACEGSGICVPLREPSGFVAGVNHLTWRRELRHRAAPGAAARSRGPAWHRYAVPEATTEGFFFFFQN